MTYMLSFSTPGMIPFAEAVDDERQRQLAQWGPQPLPDGTGSPEQVVASDFGRRLCQAAFDGGYGTHAHVLAEEVGEALAESDPVKLKAELIQVAAVCAKWIADIDARPKA